MSPFKEIYRDPSGDEVSRELSCPGFHKVLDKPSVFLNVTGENKADLWVIDNQGLKVVGEERDRNLAEQLVPVVHIDGSEGREVVLYDGTSEERVRIGWEPSFEEQIRQVEKRVREKVKEEKEGRYFPISYRLASRWDEFKPSRVKFLKDKKVPLREKIVLGAMMSGELIGSVVSACGELLFVWTLRGLNDRVTGYWPSEEARLTTEYFSELEVEK
jgi:hypothetical protein